jgi:hypothetical protein
VALSEDLTAREDAVRRLRAMHDDAADDDRPRAALQLGLAIADIVTRLPADDSRRAELADEGLRRLDESGDTTLARIKAAEVLSRYQRAAPGPAPVRLPGADLNWDVDWPTLRGPTEAARKMLASLPMVASALSPGAGQAVTGIVEVLGAFDQGQWTAEHDARLASAYEALKTADLGTDLGLMLRFMATVIRIERCRTAERETGRAYWPPVAELDELIADMESAEGLHQDLGGQFQAANGTSHMFIGQLIMTRIMVDIRSRGDRRDETWRVDTIRLFRRAEDHLRQAPPAFGGLLRPVLDQVNEAIATLDRAGQPGVATGDGRVAAPPAPQAAPPPPAKPRPAPPVPPPAATPDQVAAPGPGEPSGLLDGSIFERFSSPALAGLQVLAEEAGGPVLTAMAAMKQAADAVLARRWTPECDQALDRLQREADRLAGQDGSELPARALVNAVLAMLRSARLVSLSVSPRPEEHPARAEAAGVIAEVEVALEFLAGAKDRLPATGMFGDLSNLLHMQAGLLLTDLAKAGDGPPDAGLLARARAHMDQMPPGLPDKFPVLGDLSTFLRVFQEGRPGTADAKHLNERYTEASETGGGGLNEARATAARAKQSRNADDIASAITQLYMGGIGLPVGSPMHAGVLVSLAEMQNLLAVHTSYPLALVDAVGSGLEAARAAAAPGDVRSAAHILTTSFCLMVSKGQRDGPLEQVEEVLRAASAHAPADDWPLRITATVALGAAMGLRAAASDDEALRRLARQAIMDAEEMLPEAEPTGQWYGTARILYTWAAVQTLCGHDAELAPVALRTSSKLECVLVSHPDVAAQMDQAQLDPGRTGEGELEGLRQARQRLLACQAEARTPGQATGKTAGPQAAARGDGRPRETAASAGEARRLALRGLDQAATVLGLDATGGRARRPLAAAGRPEPASLRASAADLHARLAGVAADSDLSRRIDGVLGICVAELYWADSSAESEQGLQDAVVHLQRALAIAHPRPTVQRADLLDILARCYREAGRRHDDQAARANAERAARAALRELARCVLVSEDTDRALEAAVRANEITARAIGWCLADGRHRAAVEMAEAGRGLVLAGVVLAGRVDETLRGAGRPDVADAWRDGSEAGRIAAINALWDTDRGGTLLATPRAEEISVMLAGTTFDAVVYLVPPVAPDQAGSDDADLPGHAVVLRPVLGQITVLDLPGLADLSGTPLEAYLAALDNALAAYDPRARHDGGFRSGPQGQAWADAVESLGAWTYSQVMGPLIEHARGWPLDHLPHLALIPLGKLAAIPYAAAWTGDPASPSGRRYAIDDVVLSYAASARLLGEVARRPRQRLAERVVLISDPAGEFPMTRRSSRSLARHQYPGAEVYGLKSERNGPATTAALLAALPGRDQPGASLLQLSTHATTVPTARLQTRDGWLELTRILDQARDRPADAPGGLVIANACLTDSTQADYDESLTLATAFLAAGATAVIGTRWPVDDDTTAALSFRLHHHLHMGLQPAEALRRAQLDLLRPQPDVQQTMGPHLAALDAARLSHPVTWAGSVHHGI